MPYEMIATLMFSTMMLMLLTGQRVFGAIGFVAVAAALLLWGDKGGFDIGFSAAMKLMKWYPLLTLPMFIFMGYVLSESKIADDLYKMFHVWMGGLRGGLAIGTIGLMVLISAMNGLSVAGMAIGATIALPELLKRGYDKRMVTGVIQAEGPCSIDWILKDNLNANNRHAQKSRAMQLSIPKVWGNFADRKICVNKL